MTAANLAGQASLARSMFYLAWPSLLLSIIQASLAVVDASLASRLGLDYLAAITVVYPFYMLMQIVALGGFGGAVAAHVARAAGAKNAGLVRETALMALGLSFAIGMTCSLAYGVFGEALSQRLLKTPESAQLALHYGFWLIGLAPVFWVSNCVISIARGLGLMKQILWVACLVYPLQVLAISMCVLLMGVHSIWALSLATLLGSLSLGLYLASRLVRHPFLNAHALAGQWRKILASMGSIGFFTSTSSIITGLALVVLSAVAGSRYGRDALSAYGIMMRIEVIMMMIASSVGVAVVNTCAGALGRKDPDTAKASAQIGVSATVVLVGAVGILFALVPDLALWPFSLTEPVRAHAQAYLSKVGWTFPLMALGFSSLFVGQGLQRPRLFFFTTVARFVFLVVATEIFADDFATFCNVVAAAYCMFGTLAIICLLYERFLLQAHFLPIKGMQNRLIFFKNASQFIWLLKIFRIISSGKRKDLP